MTQDIRLIWSIVSVSVLLGLVVLSSTATAAPTDEQVRRVMTERAIPNWKKASIQASELKASPRNSSWSEFWRALDDQVKSVSGTAALAKASNPSDSNELFANAAWLRWKVLSENADGRYSYVYSFVLSHMKGPDGDYLKEAAVFLYHARLAIAIDGARCVDRSSPESYISGYETQKTFQWLLEKVGKMTTQEKAVALLEAVSIEEMRGERTPYEWLCTQGVRTELHAMNQGRQPQKVEQPDKDNRNVLGQGNTYTIDTSGIKAELVPEREWKKIRREILDRNISNAAKGL